MNFLAHIYLSGDDDLIKIGNFMADGIRGKHFLIYPEKVQKGIILHRAIDSFTDAHPVFRQSTKRLHAVHHHYSAVIVDVFYDHFLAKNWQKYSEDPLELYISNFYRSLEKNREILTERTKGMMPYMIDQNWLLSYKSVDGIEHILSQMDRRTKHRSIMKNSVKSLREFYNGYENEFNLFFEDLSGFVKIKLATL